MKHMDLIMHTMAGIFVFFTVKKETGRIDAYVFLMLNISLFIAAVCMGGSSWMIVLIPMLLGVSIIDVRKYIIPDILAILILTNRLLCIASIEELVCSMLNGLCIFLYVLSLSFILDRMLRKETIGGGDIKLYSSLSMYQGIYANILSIILSCLIGLLWMMIGKRKKIPFGPCICMAYYIVFICTYLASKSCQTIL